MAERLNQPPQVFPIPREVAVQSVEDILYRTSRGDREEFDREVIYAQENNSLAFNFLLVKSALYDSEPNQSIRYYVSLPYSKGALTMLRAHRIQTEKTGIREPISLPIIKQYIYERSPGTERSAGTIEYLLQAFQHTPQELNKNDLTKELLNRGALFFIPRDDDIEKQLPDRLKRIHEADTDLVYTLNEYLRGSLMSLAERGPLLLGFADMYELVKAEHNSERMSFERLLGPDLNIDLE